MEYIAYYRVSTDRQARSGLGLDAQREAVERYIAAHGAKLLATYTEAESGKRNDRPELAKALAHAKKTKATLVIAKLDRLSRNLAFIANLMESGVEFVCCDMPSANSLTLHIIASVAEYERKLISERTKAALAQARARGVRLGNPNTPRNVEMAVKAHSAAALERARVILDIADELYEESGRTQEPTLAEIAAALNERDIPTERGGPWGISSVSSLLLRYGDRA